MSLHHPNRKSFCIAQQLIGHAAAEEPFDAGRPMPPADDCFMLSVPSLFQDISRDIILMAYSQRHPAPIEAGLRQRLARLDQEWTLTFCFLSNPGFLVLAQLLTQAGFGGGILRSAMLQQPPRHGLEDVKQRDGGFRRLAQKRSHILHRAMGVLRFIDSHKNSHSILQAGRVEQWTANYNMLREATDSRERLEQV